MNTTIGSVHLAQEEILVRFAAMQAQIVDAYNGAGRGCLVREPTPTQLAGIKTQRQLEALVLTCTRPLPDTQWRAARSPR
jgi:hypothetical protein